MQIMQTHIQYIVFTHKLSLVILMTPDLYVMRQLGAFSGISQTL